MKNKAICCLINKVKLKYGLDAEWLMLYHNYLINKPPKCLVLPGHLNYAFHSKSQLSISSVTIIETDTLLKNKKEGSSFSLSRICILNYVNFTCVNATYSSKLLQKLILFTLQLQATII